MEGRYISKHSGVGISEALDFEKHFNEYGAQAFAVKIGKPDNDALAQYISTTDVEVEKIANICSFKNLLPIVPDDIQLPYDGFKPNFAHQDIPDCALTLTSLRALQKRSEDDNKKLNKNVLRYRGEMNLDVNREAMFYLGNNFYIDTRNPENSDYTQTIRKWGETQGYTLGSVNKMEESTWCCARGIRLGYPYLYMHQRFCEHLIVITDARLLHDSDCMDSTKYPIMRSFANLQGKYCVACRKKPSKYLVVGNDRLPHEVAHFCTICLTLFNYVNRIKIGNFQVYKYVDRASLI